RLGARHGRHHHHPEALRRRPARPRHEGRAGAPPRRLTRKLRRLAPATPGARRLKSRADLSMIALGEIPREGRSMPLSNRLIAEFVGTFWLVLGGCGSAVLALDIPQFSVGLTGVSLAFGLTVLTMAYALGPVSGGHFNPAVSVGLMVGGRFPARDVIPYVLAQ